ncbi:MAG: hypothetical protein IKW39_04125, partial [Alphaproteobacteria bacterium]|nr:hypothetical protein [Alphaproteobacteria bacterium]
KYYENNIKSSSIPYVNGQKEGVAKYYYENGYMQFQCGYVEDLMDGEARMYDNEGKVLYNIMTANDKFVSGTCNYMNEKNEVNTKDIPSLLLEAFNAKCLLLGSKIAKNHCSIDKINKTKDCNPKCLEKNKKEINSYLKTYIKDNSVEKNKNS